METNFVQFLSSKSLLPAIPITTNTSPIKPTQPLIFVPCRITYPVLNSTHNSGDNDDNPPPQPAPSTLTPADTVEIRFKRGSRRRRNKQLNAQSASAKAPDPPKKWEDMNLTEKALELYMGEKGLLFWLNKFAYASIFIIIGGWILFRFVGPSLNLYQLDAPPLPPSSMFKGT